MSELSVPNEVSVALWLILASVFTFKAMALFSLSLKAHWKQVRPEPNARANDKTNDAPAGQPYSTRLKACAWMLLALSAGACLQADHASMAVLVWVMLIATSAFIVGMILAYRPALLKVFALNIFEIHPIKKTN